MVYFMPGNNMNMPLGLIHNSLDMNFIAHNNNHDRYLYNLVARKKYRKYVKV